MASIMTGIQLQDNFSAALYQVIDAVNLAVSAMVDMQDTMDVGMDMSSLEGAREQLNSATVAVQEMNDAIGRMATIQPSMPEPIQWHSDNLDVFASTGIERFQQEVESTNVLLQQLCSTQDNIARQAYNTNLFPPETFQDLNSMAVRIDNIRNRIQQIASNPINIGTDQANAEFEQLRAQLEQAITEQNELNAAIQNMDISEANAAYLRLSQTVSNTERYIRDNVDEQGRFTQEIRAGTAETSNLMRSIMGAVAAYASIQTVKNVLNTSDELMQTTSRLNMMNDGLQSTEELVNMVYVAAQDARGSFAEMSDVVARFGNNAGDAFSSTQEVVAFADLIQKQMTIAGASTTEASNAMLQLSQALGSGVLRGDELNSIFEQAPNLIQNIADYLQVPIGDIREMASEGELSADVVKAAIFANADEINAKFESMPMTWGQIWQSMQNTALIAFQPVLQKLNDIANSEAFQTSVNGVIEAMATLANISLDIFDLMVAGGNFVADHWSIISPIIYGIVAALAVYAGYLAITKAAELIGAAVKIAMCVASYAHAAAIGAEASATAAATAAQYGLNTAFLSCPIIWIILAIIALIAVIFAVCNAIAKMTGVAESGLGVICGALTVADQFFKNLFLTVANGVLGIGSAIAALGSNIKAAFHNAIYSAQERFYELLSVAWYVIGSIGEALNKLGFDIDYSGAMAAADNYAAKAAEAIGNKEEYTSITDAFSAGFSTFDAFQDGWASDAFAAGAAWGDGIADRISNFSLSDIFGAEEIPGMDDYQALFDNAGVFDNLDSIAADTAGISDSLDISSEDLKYLRDLAEQEAINRFTTAEINVEMHTTNTINKEADLDGIVDGLTKLVLEGMEQVQEGV